MRRAGGAASGGAGQVGTGNGPVVHILLGISRFALLVHKYFFADSKGGIKVTQVRNGLSGNHRVKVKTQTGKQVETQSKP